MIWHSWDANLDAFSGLLKNKNIGRSIRHLEIGDWMESSPDSGTSVIEISWHFHLEMRDLSEKVGAKKSLGLKNTEIWGTRLNEKRGFTNKNV